MTQLTTDMNFDVNVNSEYTIFSFSPECSLVRPQKNAKSSPRWQYNSMDIKRCKDLKLATDLIEDERDPDVIPAQYCKSSRFPLLLHLNNLENVFEFHIQFERQLFIDTLTRVAFAFAFVMLVPMMMMMKKEKEKSHTLKMPSGVFPENSKIHLIEFAIFLFLFSFCRSFQ